jgi:DNA-binding beta-propeller fold protein YncE
LAVNTPDNRLEIFTIDGSGNLTAAGSVPVGMEPVAVAARTDTEVWVVNHLSDSVSIVDLGGAVPRVVNTLLVGDEPRDIVFAGSDGAGNLVGNRAFITTAHRGQNSGVPTADFITEGFERADVWVFDALDLGTAIGGTPVNVVELFGDTPRALARNADGSRVYAAVFHSGNRTTAINEGLVCNGGAGAAPCCIGATGSPTAPPCTSGRNLAPGGLTAPNPLNCTGQTQPETGIIVKFNGTQWVDEAGRNWSSMVKLELPDQDVFAIDADAASPAATGAPWAGVGTILFNMAVNPVSGRIYVSNTEAKNERRFEGPGTCSTTVQGRLHQARITVLDGASVNPRHLNKHINYNVRPAPASVRADSLATPLDMVVTPDGGTLYVAAFGSSKVGRFNTAQLEANTFTPDESTHISVTGGGPSGLVLRGNRLYVFTRFDNGISTIDTTANDEIAHRTLFNPEPANVVTGRPVLYDAVNTSSNGEASCSSCHVFGDFDSLAWDLGNPDDSEVTSPIPQKIPTSFTGSDPDFFPMKGPMTTQSLRGMAHHGAMHWRGDRSVGVFGTGAFDEELSFKNFIVAFPGLLGRNGQIPVADMQKFADFMLDVTYPPNPIRNLNNSLNATQTSGSNAYFSVTPTDTLFNCDGCHTLDPAQGFFGTDGSATFEGETQHFKVPHLRNAYQKIGMFGMPVTTGIATSEPTGPQGPQVRGFGFLHDGAIPTVHRFLSSTVFSTTDTQERNLEAFILAYPSTLAPIVGQQITLTNTNAATVGGRITLMIQRAQAAFALVNHPGARECDLIVKGTIAGEQRGWRMSSVSGAFLPDKAADATRTDLQLRALANTPGQELTYTCAPPGSGIRMGIDRDLDGILDGDEGAPSPAGGCTPAPQAGCAQPGKSLLIVKQNANDDKDKVTWKWLLGTSVVADFGAPDVGDGYGLCVYQGGSRILATEAPAAGICGTRPCWRNDGASGFRYTDSATTPNGLLKLVLKPGTGTAKITAKGRGANLVLPTLPLTTPLTVQVQGSHGECWEHVYNTAGVVRNDATQFKGNGG